MAPPSNTRDEPTTEPATTEPAVRGDAPALHSLRRHLIAFGAILMVAAVATRWLTPEASALWLTLALVVAFHLGVLLMVGGANASRVRRALERWWR